MELIKIEIERFKKEVYPQYLKLFPESERKSYQHIKNGYDNEITKIFEIRNNGQMIGFAIANTLEKSSYIQLDYFAILPQYQCKGYGKEALKLLKEKYSCYDGIFIEVEKVGLGKDEKDNKLRQRRVKFYEQIGFYKMNVDLDLFKVIYSPYILTCTGKKEEEEKILKDIFYIYNTLLGEERVKSNCKVITSRKLLLL